MTMIEGTVATILQRNRIVLLVAVLLLSSCMPVFRAPIGLQDTLVLFRLRQGYGGL